MGPQVVIDANASLGLFLRLPYSNEIDQWMRAWQKEEARLVVPFLWEYECVTGLRRAVTLKLISAKEAEHMMEDLLALEFQRMPPSLELHKSALKWAERIGQSKVYDAHYLALAEDLSAEFWTVDLRLFHSLQGQGLPWVHSL
jgi:predicted nucleic acid-binding protein